MNVPSNVRASLRPRSMGLLLVIAFHVALAWLLVNGLGLRLALAPPPDSLQGRILDATPRKIVPPVPVEPRGEAETRVVIDPPEVNYATETAAADEGSITTVVDGSGTATSEAPPVHRVGVTVDARHPLTQPPYPAQSVRLEEEGTVTLEVRVGIDGRVHAARVLQSSGFPRLDAAALEEAGKAWRLRPANEDGTAVEAWYAVKVRFRLDRR